MAGTSNSIITHNVLKGTLNSDNVISGLVNTAFNPAYALVTQAGAQIVLFINSSDYKMYAQLKDKNGNLIYTSNVIDLPLETMVVDGRYDSNTKKLVLVLDNGNEIEIPLGALISGLVNEDDLEANYYDKNEIDTLLEGYWTKIEITQEDIDNWNAKQEYLNQGDGIEISAETTLKGNTSQSLVPSGYTQVDYLHCNAQQYIDTGYTPVQGDNFEFKNVTINYNTLFSAGNRTYQLILLSQDTTPATNYFRYFSNTAQSYISNITNANIRIENGAFYVNNEQVMTSTYDGNVNTNLFIGIRENGQNPFFGNFGEIIITNGTTTKKHYIPCYRNSDNVIGLYDIVNNQFLTNAGTGEFTYGNVLPTSDNPIPVNVVTGNNSVKVEGKNLFSGLTKGIRIYSSNGEQYSNNSGATSDYIPVNFATSDYYASGFLSTLYNFIAAYNSNKQFLGRTAGGPATGRLLQSNSFTNGTPQGTGDIAYLRITTYEDTSLSGHIDDIDNAQIQLEKGSQATLYEPYQSQTHPINLGSMELCKIGDYQDYIAKSTGKNLINSLEYHRSCNSSTGVVSTPSSSTNSYLSIEDYVNVKPNTTYTVSFQHDDLTGNLFIGTKDINGNFIERLGLGAVRTFTTRSNVHQIFIFIYKSGENYTIDGWTQLVEGSTALPYEPYGKVWYKYGAIGKYVFTGNESFSKYGAQSYYNSSDFDIFYPTTSSSINGYCNKVIRVNNVLSTTYITHASAGKGVEFRNTNDLWGFTGSTVEEFKTWLSTQNVILYYIAKTPTITEITDTTLIYQLDNLSIGLSNKWIKNISQTNAEIPFELEYDNTNLTISANLTDYYTKTETNTLLSGKVGFNDYGTTNTGGVIRDGITSLGYEIVQTGANVGKLGARILSYTQYQNNLYTNGFIGKGTLENVLNERIGNIQTLLDNLNTGSGV